METIYIIKNLKGKIAKDVAYRTEESARRFVQFENYIMGEDYLYYESVEVPFAKRSVCYLSLYRGFDYGIDSIYDLYSESEVFACSDYAKNHPLWKKYLKLAEEKPDEHIIRNDLIASTGTFDDEPWFYGDCFENKFNLSIRRLKVRR